MRIPESADGGGRCWQRGKGFWQGRGPEGSDTAFRGEVQGATRLGLDRRLGRRNIKYLDGVHAPRKSWIGERGLLRGSSVGKDHVLPGSAGNRQDRPPLRLIRWCNVVPQKDVGPLPAADRHHGLDVQPACSILVAAIPWMGRPGRGSATGGRMSCRSAREGVAYHVSPQDRSAKTDVEGSQQLH